MKLSQLPKTTTKSKKRIGRGYGSGRGGHTSTRGAKGQLARGSVSPLFAGTKLKKSWLKRLPLVRGKNKLTPRTPAVVALNLNQLGQGFPAKAEVSWESLRAKGWLKRGSGVTVKVLGKGELKIPLTVRLPCSRSAKQKIEKAGGKVIYG